MLEIANISKSFKSNAGCVNIFDDASFTLNKGDIACILGESGVGKSTLLKIIGGMMKKDRGNIFVDGKEIKEVFSKDRINTFGYIFQSHCLLPEFTIQENLYLPLIIANKEIKKNKEKINYYLDKFFLYDKRKSYPIELSDGQCQRISIIRAILNDPKIILAGEPTGNLDKNNSELILELFVKLNEELDKIFIIATHDMKVKNISNKIFEINNMKVNLIKDE